MREQSNQTNIFQPKHVRGGETTVMKAFKKSLLTLLAIALVFTMSVPAFAANDAKAEPAAEVNGDVDGTIYEDAVQRLGALKVLEGFPDGTFRPDETITRAQLAAVAVRLLGLEDAAKNATGVHLNYKDEVPEWAQGYISIASQQGIVTGYPDGTVRPNAPVTQVEALAMIVRVLGYEPAVAKTGWPNNYLVVANQVGLTEGVTTLNANAEAKRGEVAIFADNALVVPKLIQVGFGDFTRYAVSGNEGTKEQTILVNNLKATKYENAIVVESKAVLNTDLDKDEVKVLVWNEEKADDSDEDDEYDDFIFRADDDSAIFGKLGSKVDLYVKNNYIFHFDNETPAVETYMYFDKDGTFAFSDEDSADDVAVRDYNKYEFADTKIDKDNLFIISDMETADIKELEDEFKVVTDTKKGTDKNGDVVDGEKVRYQLNYDRDVAFLLHINYDKYGLVNEVNLDREYIDFETTFESKAKDLKLKGNEYSIADDQGNKMALKDIKAGDLIYYWTDEDDEAFTIVVHRNHVKGTLDNFEEKKSNGKDIVKKAQIDGKTFDVASDVDFEGTVSSNKIKAFKSFLGEDVTAVINREGDIQYLYGKAGTSDTDLQTVLAYDIYQEPNGDIKVRTKDFDNNKVDLTIEEDYEDEIAFVKNGTKEPIYGSDALDKVVEQFTGTTDITKPAVHPLVIAQAETNNKNEITYVGNFLPVTSEIINKGAYYELKELDNDKYDNVSYSGKVKYTEVRANDYDEKNGRIELKVGNDSNSSKVYVYNTSATKYAEVTFKNGNKDIDDIVSKTFDDFVTADYDDEVIVVTDPFDPTEALAVLALKEVSDDASNIGLLKQVRTQKDDEIYLEINLDGTIVEATVDKDDAKDVKKKELANVKYNAKGEVNKVESLWTNKVYTIHDGDLDDPILGDGKYRLWDVVITDLDKSKEYIRIARTIDKKVEVNAKGEPIDELFQANSKAVYYDEDDDLTINGLNVGDKVHVFLKDGLIDAVFVADDNAFPGVKTGKPISESDKTDKTDVVKGEVTYINADGMLLIDGEDYQVGAATVLYNEKGTVIAVGATAIEKALAQNDEVKDVKVENGVVKSLVGTKVASEIAKAQPVITAIDALPQDGTDTGVAAARTAYDALTNSQKDLVTNYAKLVSAEAAVAKKAAETLVHALFVDHTADPLVLATGVDQDQIDAAQVAVNKVAAADKAALQTLVDAAQALFNLDAAETLVHALFVDHTADPLVLATGVDQDQIDAAQVAVNKVAAADKAALQTLVDAAQELLDIDEAETALAAADTTLKMRNFLEKYADVIGIDVTDAKYVANKDTVANEVLAATPTTLDAVKTAFNDALDLL